MQAKEAAPIIEQLKADGLLKPCRAYTNSHGFACETFLVLKKNGVN